MVRILYFGVARDLAGCAEEPLDLDGAATVAMLWQRLTERHPRLEAIRAVSRVAVDMQYATDVTAIADASEVAIIPPVAGG
jgi:sulfur-carrier protein